jgi:hypothetical protein
MSTARSPAEPNARTANIFVGSDRSQLLAVRVLDYSIRRRTTLNIALRSMHDLELPDAADPRHAKRTGFSFSRFAIPALAGYQGRALYLDADMLVLRDLRELYEMPFNGAKVLVQGESSPIAGAPARRIRQSSVMLLDCGALNWNAAQIIAGLGVSYAYEDLMQKLCILEPNQIGYAIPLHWNSLEIHEPDRTGLLHYTDMNTQPWVHAANPNGFLWVNELREMLNDGALHWDELRDEVRLGYVRPSLLSEIQTARRDEPDTDSGARWRALDAASGFRPHREFLQQTRARDATAHSPKRASIADRWKTLTQRLQHRRRRTS